MKTKNLLLVLAIAGFTFFSSCKKNDDPSPLTKEQAEATFTSVNSDYNAIKTEYETSQAYLVQEAIGELYTPFNAPMKSPAKPKSIQKDLLNTIKPAFAKTGGSDDPFIYFDFNEHVGTWTYDTISHYWNHTATPTDKVVLIFPYKDGTATLTYSDYETKIFESEIYISQLKFKAEVSGQTTPVFSWDYTASMTSTGESASMVYNFGKFTQTMSYSANKNITATSGSIDASILLEFKKEGVVVYSTSATINVSGSRNSFTVAITAKIVIMEVEIRLSINGNQNTNFDGDPNKFMKMSVWKTNGAKVADIVLIYDNTIQDYVPYFKFSDGTTVKVEDRLKNKGLLESINDFIDSIMSFGDLK